VRKIKIFQDLYYHQMKEDEGSAGHETEHHVFEPHGIFHQIMFNLNSKATKKQPI